MAASFSQMPLAPPPYAESESAAADDDRSSSASTLGIIFLISVVVLALAIFLLHHFLSKRLHRSSGAADEDTDGDDVVSWRDSNRSDARVAPHTHSLLDTLPVFTFRSVNGNLGGDCAVCLSKFEAEDQLRLLPLCCHAFHAECIDAWIVLHQTCPLCRSAVVSSDADLLDKIASNDNRRVNSRSGSFRLEIGSISRRRSDSPPEAATQDQRSYPIGSFDYVVNENGYEIPVGSTTHRGRDVSVPVSNYASSDKESFVGIPMPEPPGESLAAEISGGRNWLREYMDRLPSVSFSSRGASFRSSGRFFSGSSRRSDNVATAATAEDLEANRVGEAISEFFRWLSET